MSMQELVDEMAASAELLKGIGRPAPPNLAEVQKAAGLTPNPTAVRERVARAKASAAERAAYVRSPEAAKRLAVSKALDPDAEGLDMIDPAVWDSLAS